MEQLTLTENAQPALMATSLAAVRALEARWAAARRAACGLRRRPFARRVFGAGGGRCPHHRATPRACCACAAERCRRRSPVGDGAMAAILGLDVAAVEGVAAERPGHGQGVCEVANDNGAGPGRCSAATKAAVERATIAAKERGAKRAMLLQVSAPFHCALMGPAAAKLQAALADVPLRQARRTPDRQRHGRGASSEPDAIAVAAGRAGDRRACAGARSWLTMAAQGVDSVRRARRRARCSRAWPSASTCRERR